MMRLITIVLLIIGLLAGLVMFMPLGTVLNLARAEARGLSWTAVDGTLLGGSIRGLRAGDELLGDGTLQLQPSALLRLGIQYTFDWSGPAGSGTGKAAVYAGGAMELTDFDILFSFAALDGLALWIRQSGGEARITGPLIRFRDNACSAADGVTSSNAFQRNEALLGPGWPEMTGRLSCLGPDLAIPFSAQSASGTQVDTLIRFSFQHPGTVEARVSGFIPQDFQYALPIAGFLPDGNAFIYRYPPLITGTPP